MVTVKFNGKVIAERTTMQVGVASSWESVARTRLGVYSAMDARAGVYSAMDAPRPYLMGSCQDTSALRVPSECASRSLVVGVSLGPAEFQPPAQRTASFVPSTP